MFLSLLINCTTYLEYPKIETEKIYRLKQPLEIGVADNDNLIKIQTREAVSTWNRLIGKDIFNYQPSFLSFLRFKKGVLIMNGATQSRCINNSNSLAYTIAHLDNKTHDVVGGRIFLCIDQITFNKNLGKKVDMRSILIHELGHILSSGHYSQSNILHPSRLYTFPSHFDLNVVLPAIKKKIQF